MYKKIYFFYCSNGLLTKLVKKYNCENCKQTKIPMQTILSLEKEPKISWQAEKIEEGKYQELVKSFLYYIADHQNIETGFPFLVCVDANWTQDVNDRKSS